MNISSARSSIESLYGTTRASSSSESGSASSGTTSSGATSSSDGTYSNATDLSVSQIRNRTDQMASEGQLSPEEQMALMGYSLQDADTTIPGYQPTGNATVGFEGAAQAYQFYETSAGNTCNISVEA